MENLTLAMVVTAVALFLLLASGLWIGLAVGGAGMLLYVFFIEGGFYPISVLQFNVLNSITWTAMPLFIFMGIMIFKCGLGERLYKLASASVGSFPGGLLHTNIISCAIFAACTGSSIACAATMGAIAIPELTKRKYDKRMVLGSLASAGTLGIMIPPSVSFIVYGAVVGESVGKLFMAGVFPGLMLVGLFMLYIAVAAIISPEKTPGREPFDMQAFLVGLWQFTPVALIIQEKVLEAGKEYQAIGRKIQYDDAARAATEAKEKFGTTVITIDPVFRQEIRKKMKEGCWDKWAKTFEGGPELLAEIEKFHENWVKTHK